MAGANRRIILVPAGLDEEALARLHEQWVQAAAQQNRLAARSAHVLQLTTVPQRTAFGLVVEHEPAEPLGLKDLFDPTRLPAGHDAAEQKRLLRIAAGLFDALRVAHEGTAEGKGPSGQGGLRSAIFHGGICPGTVLTSPEGIVKVTDFGFARAVCSVLGPESYLNLAVAPRSGGVDELSASGLWEILNHDAPGRDDRISAFIDPQIHMTQEYNVFESSQDIIAAGFLLYLLAEHRHPYFYTDFEAHRDVDVATQIMPATQPTRLHRKCLNEDSPNPAMKLWCRLVDRMIDRLPQERPTASRLAEDLGQFEPPVGMGDILARRLDALYREMDGLGLAEVPWEEVRARAGALGGGAGVVSAGVSEQARAIAQLCDAAQVLYGPQWQNAGPALADLSGRSGTPEAVSRKARQAAEVLQSSAAVQADLERIEADLQAAPADALGPLQQAARQLDGLVAGRPVLPPVAARAAALTAQVQEQRRAAEARLQALTQKARQWLETVEAALQGGQWDEVERLLGQAPPIPASAGGVQARAEAIAAQLRAHRQEVAARQERQAALTQRLQAAAAALAREAFAEVRTLLEPVQKQKEFPDLAAKAGPLRQQCDERERLVLRRQRQETLERQLQEAEAALGRDAFGEVRALLEPVQKQTEFADLAELAALLRQQCDDQEREISRRQRHVAMVQQLEDAEESLGRDAFAEARVLLEPAQAQEEFPDLAEIAGQLRKRCDQQERQVLQRQEALRQARAKADTLLEEAQKQVQQDTAGSLEQAATLVGQTLDLAGITPEQQQRGQQLRSRIEQRLHAIQDEQQRRVWLLHKAQEQLQAASDLLAEGRLQDSQAKAEPLAVSDLPEVRTQAEHILAQIAKAIAQHRGALGRQLAAAREALPQGQFEAAAAAARQVQEDPYADDALRDGARQVIGAIARTQLEAYRAGLARQLEQAAEHIRRARPPQAVQLAEQVLKDSQADETLQQEAQKILRQAERAAQEIQKARQEADQDRGQAIANLRKADLPAARRHAERVLQNPYAETDAKTRAEEVLRDLAPLEAAQALADRQEYAEALQAFDTARASTAPEGPAVEAADLLRQRAVEQRSKALHQAIERHLTMRAQRQRKAPDLKALAAAESLPKGSPAWLVEAVEDLESLLQEYEARARPAGKADVLAAAGRIADRFEVLECVRADAFGEAYRAKDCRGGQALRLERLGTIEVPTARQGGLRRLVESLSGLVHPGLLRLRAVEVAAGRLCVAREWTGGLSLEEAKDLPARQVAEILAAVGQALAHAHAQQVVHGDIRPAGILLGDPAGGAVRVADLGTAQLWGLARRRSHLLLRGTPGYIAPEVVTSLGEQAAAASDVFALGGVLYTVLSGKPPFAQPASGNGNAAAVGAEILLRTLRYDLLPLAKAAPQAPEGLRRICERAMARKPEDRYADAGQIARDLQLFALQLDAQEVQAALARAQALFDKRPQNQVSEIQSLEGAAAEAEKVQHLAEEAAGLAAQAADLAGPEPAAAAKKLIERATALRSMVRQTQERIVQSQAGAKKQLKAASEALASGRLRVALDAASGVSGNGYVPDLHPQAKQIEAAALAGLQRTRGKRLKVVGIAAAVMLVVGAGGYWWMNRPAAPSKPAQVAQVDPNRTEPQPPAPVPASKPRQPDTQPAKEVEPAKPEPAPASASEQTPTSKPAPEGAPPKVLEIPAEPFVADLEVIGSAGPVNKGTPVKLRVRFGDATAKLSEQNDVTALFEVIPPPGVTPKGIQWDRLKAQEGFEFTIKGLPEDGQYTVLLKAGAAIGAKGNRNRDSNRITIPVDNTPPGIAISEPSRSDTNSGPVKYTVTYGDHDKVSLSETHITLNRTVKADGKVAVTNSGNIRTVTISGITGDGTLGISIGVETATDAAGNKALASGPSKVFRVDNTAPTVLVAPAEGQNRVSTSPIHFTAKFSDKPAHFDETKVPVEGTAGANLAVVTPTADPVVYDVAVSGMTQAGSVKVTVPKGEVTDAAGNGSAAATAEVTYVAAGWPQPDDDLWNGVWKELGRLESQGWPWLKWRQRPSKVGMEVTLTLALPEKDPLQATIKWEEEFKKKPEDVAKRLAEGWLEDARTKAKAGGGKASTLVQYVARWQDRKALEEDLLKKITAQGGGPLPNGEPVSIPAGLAAEYLGRISQIKWMGQGSVSQASLEARTSDLRQQLFSRTKKKVSPNRFIECFWGINYVHVICWATDVDTSKTPPKAADGQTAWVLKDIVWYMRCDRDKALADPGKEIVGNLVYKTGFFPTLPSDSSKQWAKWVDDDSFGIAIAPDGPLYFKPLTALKFGQSVNGDTSVTVYLPKLGTMGNTPLPSGSFAGIQSLSDLCSNAGQRSVAIWNCTSLDEPAPSESAVINVLRAAWAVQGSSSLPAVRAEKEGGILLDTSGRAGTPPSYTKAVTGIDDTYRFVEIAGPRGQSTDGQTYVYFVIAP